MDATPCPAIFVSHGPPNMVVDPIAVRHFLETLGGDLPRPRAVLCVSAHWITAVPSVTGSERPETIHDFFGFAPAASPSSLIA